MKRTLSLLLAVFTVFTALATVGCADNNDPSLNPTPTADPSATAVPSENPDNPGEEKTVYTADIPEGYGWGGNEFRISVYDNSNSTWYDVDFSATEMISDVINDAAFKRMNEVEDKLAVDIVSYPSQSYGLKNINDCTNTGDDLYDCGLVAARYAVSLAEKAALVDLYESGLDMEAPWWDQNCIEGLTIADRLYLIAGDISILYRKSLRVMYFNKQIALDHDITDLYAMVENGTWTLEELADCVSLVSKDLNGDDAMDDHDLYGIIYTVDTMGTGLVGGGVSLVVKDADGYPTLAFYNDYTLDVFEQLCNIIYDKSHAYCGDISANSGYMTTKEMFMSDQALFSSCELHNVASFRAMETDFGIVPNPKGDIDQENYRSTSNATVAGMTVIPVTVPADKLQDVCYVLDALGASSKNTLTPAYMDVYLQGRVSRDDESQESLNIVFNNVVFDLGYIYNWGSIQNFTYSMVKLYDTNLTSAYEKIESQVETLIATTVNKYKGIE